MLTKQEKIALRELLHQELDKCVTAYFKRNPRKFEKMMVQFGEMKIKDSEKSVENMTRMFGINLDPIIKDDSDRVFGAEDVEDLYDLFERSPVNMIENRMVIEK